MYLIIYSILLVLSLFSILNKKFNVDLNKKNLVIMIAGILTIIAGIRVEVGTDYDSYKNIFYGVNDITDYNYLEIGFRFLIVIIKLIFNHEIVFFMILSILTMFFFTKGILSTSINPIISIFIFYSVFYTPYVFNVIRQGITMSLFVFSLKYYHTNQTKKVLLISFIATLFHFSGIFILISYCIYNYKYLLCNICYFFKLKELSSTIITKFNKIKKSFNYIVRLKTKSFNCIVRLKTKYFVYWAIIYGSLGLVVYNPLTQILLNLSPRFKSYMESFDGAVDFISLSQRIFLITLITFFIPIITKKYPKMINIYHIYLFGYLMYLLFSSSEIVAARINMFFRILEVIIIPCLLECISNKYLKYLIFCLIAIWCFMLLVLQIKTTHIYPYRSIFS